MKLFNFKLFKENIILELLCSLLLSFTLFFFGPLEIFLSAPTEFWFSISDILFIIIASTLLCFIIFMAIQFIASFFGSRLLKICSSFLIALGIGFYIQGNWTFINYGKMDGTPINWNNYSGWAVANTIIWILILAVVFLLNFRYIKINICIILGIIAIETITLIVLGISSINSSPKAEFTLKGGEEFQLSSNKNNILVIVADGFDGSDFLPVLKEEPDFEQYFDGFTFYENTCGTSLYSEESGITLLTGNQFEVGPSFNENINQAYLNSDLYNILESNNYRTYLYLQYEKMVSPLIANQIANFSETKAEISDFSNAFKGIYKMVFFRYVPHIYKKLFWYTSMDFSSLKSYEEIKGSLFYNYDVYNLIENQGVLAQETDYNVYQFYWIQGPHEPANTDRYCQKIEHVIKMEDEEYSDSQFEQTIGVVRMYTKLIDALKEAGVYDNTTVIFTADHGWNIRPNPCLLIKPANSHGELVISSAPVSMITDYMSTLKYFITGKKDYGDTIYELEEDMDRERVFYIYDFNPDRTYNSRTEHYYDSSSISKVKLNKELLPSDIEWFIKSGFSNSEQTHIWTNGTEATLKFNIAEKVDNIQANLNYTTYNGIQPVSIYANDILITEYEANGSEEKSIIIPGEYIKDGELILRFEFANAIAPADIDPNSKDSRKLAFAFHSITLSDTAVQYNSNSLSKIDFGKSLSADDIESYAVTGISNTEHEFIWTDGEKAILKFNLDDKHNNIQVNLSYHTYNGIQPVSIYANDIFITEYEANGTEEKNIIIPGEYIKNGELILRFEFTNAIAPAEIDPNNKDPRKLALAFHKITLSDTSIQPSIEN